MDCRLFEERVLDYIVGDLPGEAREQMEAHLVECATCRRTLERSRDALVSIRLLKSGTSAETLVSAVSSKIERQTGAAKSVERAGASRLRRVRKTPSILVPWILPLAVAAAIVAAVLVLHQDTGIQPETRVPGPAMTTSDVQTVPAKQAAESPSRLDGTVQEPEVDTHVEAAEAPGGPEPLEFVQAVPAHEPGFVPGVSADAGDADVQAQGPERDAAPDEQGTTRPVARLALIDGNVYYRRAGSERTFRATEGIHFSAGDEFDTRFGKARVELADGAVVFCNRQTLFAFDEGRLDIRKGELYCDVKDAERLDIVSADGAVRHIGTKFLVKVRSSGTTVLVEEGKVEVENDKGRVRVETGFQVSVRKGQTPGRPRKADAAKALLWVRAMSRRVVLLADDFESDREGSWPANWRKHTEAARNNWAVRAEEPGGANHVMAPTDKGLGAGSTQHALADFGGRADDYTVELALRLTGQRVRRLGIELENATSILALDYDGGKGRFRIRDNLKNRDYTSSPCRVEAGSWHQLQVEVSGTDLTVRIDGREVASVVIEEKYTTLALSFNGNDAALFDNVVVYTGTDIK